MNISKPCTLKQKRNKNNTIFDKLFHVFTDPAVFRCDPLNTNASKHSSSLFNEEKGRRRTLQSIK